MKGAPNTSMWSLKRMVDHAAQDGDNNPIWATGDNASTYRRWAVKKLDECLGREVKCREVDDAMLKRYADLMREQGYKPKTIEGATGFIRAIIRRWNPERFKSEVHPPNTLGFMAVGIEGTLDDICVNHYLPENPRTSSPDSVRMYSQSIRTFGYFLGRPATLDDLKDATVARFQRWLVTDRKVKPISANGYTKRIIAMWNWLAKKRIVAEFPTVQRLPVAEIIPTCWTEAELQKLFAACAKVKGKVGRIPAAAYWTAFHLLAWDSGERTGALLALRWEYLDWRSGYMTVPGEVRKNAKPMLYKLKPATLAALRAIKEPPREIIFEQRGNQTTFHIRYRKLIEFAGLRYVKRRTGPQKMRRSFASFIEAAGGNATRALKHTDRRVTEQSYLDPKIVETEPENLKLFPLTGDAKGGGA